MIHRSRPPTKLERTLIQAALLPTWQTAAAIAQHAGVPARTALTVLKAYANDWRLEGRRVRVDGHNEVSMWRQRSTRMVMGVTVAEDQEEAEV
jgi:hypothetical protein